MNEHVLCLHGLILAVLAAFQPLYSVSGRLSGGTDHQNGHKRAACLQNY